MHMVGFRPVRGRRARVLSSTALGVLACSWLATPVLANTVNGAPAPAYTIKLGATVGTYNVTVSTADVGGPGSVGLSPTITPTSRVETAAIEITNAGFSNVTVIAGRLVGAHNTYSGIWINRGESNEAPYPGLVPSSATIVNNGDIQGSAFGIDITGLCGASCTSRETTILAISGTGRVFGNTGMRLSATTMNVDGLGLILGWDTGLSITASNVNLGPSTRLGQVMAGTGSGIVLNAPLTYSLRLSNVSAGGASGAAVVVAGASGGTTTNRIGFNGTLSSLGDGIRITGRHAGTIDGESTGSIVANGVGIRFQFTGTNAQTSTTNISNIQSITSGGNGIDLSGDNNTSGSVLNVWNIGAINAGGTGIRIALNSGARIGQTAVRETRRIGHISAGLYGIEFAQGPSVQFLPDLELFLTSVTAPVGVYSVGNRGPITLNWTGAITASIAGLYTFDHNGSYLINGNSTGSIQSAGAGISLLRSSFIGSNVVIQNLAAISAAAGDGVLLTNHTQLQLAAVGSITASGNGIAVFASPTNTSAVTITNPGTITAGVRGIDLSLVRSVSIFADRPITGQIDGVRLLQSGLPANTASFGSILSQNITGTTGWGILQTGSSNSAVSVVLNAGTFSGALGGIQLESGNTLGLLVGSLATVEGRTGLAVNLYASTANRTGTISNAGLIRTTSAAGSGTDVALATNGQIALTNSGTITGRVTHNAMSGFGVASLGFYNVAGGVWNAHAGVSSFGGAGDILGNAGTVNAGAGVTEFAGLETFVNSVGGVISFLGSAAATDELVVGGWLQLQDGGRLRVNFNADAALGTLDRGTSGNADSITSTLLSATGVTTIDIVATGGSNGAGAPVPLTGSVVLVSTGLALPAPAPGATLTPATNYVFGTGNPSSPARTFTLVGDGLGGVFLQWVPVTGGGTIGGFSGGSLGAADSAGGAGGGLGFLQASLAGASQAAVQVADMTSFGAAFGGAGAAGAGCGSADGASFSVRTGEWAGSGRRSASGASAQGRDLAFSPGAGANSCGRVSVGAFQFGGTATLGLQARRGTDAARGTAQGAGGYVRADSGTGFFAQVTGAAGTQRARVRNGIFGTEATVDTTLGFVDITAGYATPISDSVAIETRLSATRLTSAANPFRDSLGYEVTRLDTRADSLTATAGLIARTDSGGQGFVRAGLRTTDARQDGLAYGIRTLSQASGTSGVLEAGWTQPLGQEASVEFALTSDSGGPLERQEARVQLSFGW